MRSAPILFSLLGLPFVVASCSLSTGGAADSLFGTGAGGDAAVGTGGAGIGGATGAGGHGGNGVAGAAGHAMLGAGGSAGSAHGPVGAGGGTGGGATGQGGSGAGPGVGGMSGASAMGPGAGGMPAGPGGGATVGMGGTAAGQGGSPTTAGPGPGGGGAGGNATAQGGQGAQGGTSSAQGGSSGAQGGVGAQGGSAQAGAPSTGGGGAGGSPTGPCQTGPGPCVAALPAGWKLTEVGADAAKACPSSFTKHDLVADPVTKDGACSCSCDIQASCDSGTIKTYYGMQMCNQPGLPLTIKGSACTGLGFNANLSARFAADALVATVSCTSTDQTDTGKVGGTPVRICDAPTQCEEDLCQGMPSPGFTACIYTDGDQACPSGWPNRTVAGDSATLTCSGCKDCKASADCTGAKLHFYGDDKCTKSAADLDADGMCVQSNGASVTAFTYSANVSNQQCQATGTSQPAVGLAASRTICCR